jgi:Zn-dependent protease
MEITDILPIIAMVIALVIAIVGHEIMHGLTAYKYGDDTAKRQGRLSPNPLLHVDPVGTLVVPLVLYFTTGFVFGWAKPVPVQMRTVVRNSGWAGAIHVSLAGIAYNVILALCAAAVLGMLSAPSSLVGLFIYALLSYLVIVNIILAVFNLYPIPPLDGSHALSYLASWMGWDGLSRTMDSLGRYGFVILVALLISPLSAYLFVPMRFLIENLLP